MAADNCKLIGNKRRERFGLLRALVRLAVVAFIVLVPMSIRNTSHAVSGGSTGWCTDHSGRNYRCRTTGGTGSTGASGGGCARVMQERREAEASAKEMERRQQKQRIQRDLAVHKPMYDKWQRQAHLDDAAKRAQESEHRLQQQRESASAAVRNARANDWNDAGIAAYKGGNNGTALRYFRAATVYMPSDRDIQSNLSRAEKAVDKQAKDYLKSVQTALMIRSVSPKALLFHPDPNVRMHAQKELAKESMKKIAEASALFVTNHHLNRGKLERFKWEDPVKRAERKRAAEQNALMVEELKLKAFAEAHRKAMALQGVDVSGGKTIRFGNGPAMKRLIELSRWGFK